MAGLYPYKRTLQIAQRQVITVRGTTVFLRKADGEIKVTTRSMQVQEGMGEHYTLTMEPSEKQFTASEFDSIVIENISGAVNNIELYAGYGDYFRPVPDIVTVSVDAPMEVNVVSSNPSPAPSASIDSLPDVAVQGVAVQILPVNAGRVRAFVSAPAANVNTLRIGDAGVTAANGTPLVPGETIPYDTIAALFAIGVAASADVVALSELNL